MSRNRVLRTEIDDRAYLSQLRSLVDAYFQAVDAWEEEYQRYYRLVVPDRPSPDLEPLRRSFLEARAALLDAVPRARRLCLRYDLREPWSGLLRAALGTIAPQGPFRSAVGFGERAAVGQCLRELEASLASGPEAAAIESAPPAARDEGPKSLWRRFVDYFF